MPWLWCFFFCVILTDYLDCCVIEASRGQIANPLPYEFRLRNKITRDKIVVSLDKALFWIFEHAKLLTFDAPHGVDRVHCSGGRHKSGRPVATGRCSALRRPTPPRGLRQDAVNQKARWRRSGARVAAAAEEPAPLFARQRVTTHGYFAKVTGDRKTAKWWGLRYIPSHIVHDPYPHHG